MSGAAFSYQWLSDDVDLSGATNASYALVAADRGKRIKVKVPLTDDEDNAEELTSEPTAAALPEESESSGSFIWSATLTLGDTSGVVGYWKNVSGAPEPDEFSLDRDDYRGSMSAELDGKSFQFGLRQAIPGDFTPRVGGTTFE